MNPTSVEDAQEMSKSIVLPMKNVSVCTFKTSPCVPAPRAHMFQHVCAWCQYTRGRFERTHGDVLSGHTGFSRCHPTHTQHNTHTHTPHRTPHRTHATTQLNNTTTTPRGESDRDRQRQRKKTATERRKDGRGETREEKRRQKKTRQDKRRETIHFQCGGAWPFFVGVVIFLVHSVNERDLSLPKSVKYDSF